VPALGWAAGTSLRTELSTWIPGLKSWAGDPCPYGTAGDGSPNNASRFPGTQTQALAGAGAEPAVNVLAALMVSPRDFAFLLDAMGGLALEHVDKIAVARLAEPED
jgi:hypothetical protein